MGKQLRQTVVDRNPAATGVVAAENAIARAHVDVGVVVRKAAGRTDARVANVGLAVSRPFIIRVVSTCRAAGIGPAVVKVDALHIEALRSFALLPGLGEHEGRHHHAGDAERQDGGG